MMNIEPLFTINYSFIWLNSFTRVYLKLKGPKIPNQKVLQPLLMLAAVSSLERVAPQGYDAGHPPSSRYELFGNSGNHIPKIVDQNT